MEYFFKHKEIVNSTENWSFLRIFPQGSGKQQQFLVICIVATVIIKMLLTEVCETRRVFSLKYFSSTF